MKGILKKAFEILDSPIESLYNKDSCTYKEWNYLGGADYCDYA